MSRAAWAALSLALAACGGAAPSGAGLPPASIGTAPHPNRVEHSWIGRTGDGYRYDHAHCDKELAEELVECEYVHEPRTTRLTDHSGLSLQFSCGVSGRLDTCDPFEAASPPTLF